MTRFMRKGTTRFYWVPTLADPSAPDTTEFAAGVRLDPQIAEINGFDFTNSPIDTPDMATAFVSKIPGEDTVGDSNISFYEDDTSNPIKAALAKGNVGYVVIFPTGVADNSNDDPEDADVSESWPAIVASSSRQYSAGNEAAKYGVVFTLTGPPTDGVVDTA